MQDIKLMLDMRPRDEINAESEPKMSVSMDSLGSMLHGKWYGWSTVRRDIEEEWLKDLRMYNQQNESDQRQLSKHHAHIYIGIARTKAMSAYSRIVDVLFQSNDRHWGIEPTPVPKAVIEQHPEYGEFLDEMERRAELMEDEIDDQMIDLGYEDHLKAAILEGCILGTGVVKGVIPGVKRQERWAKIETELGEEWDIEINEIPTPAIGSPSIFDIYPDPYANQVADMTGIFERHLLNRQQLADLKDDPRFDADKINEILAATDKGNYVPLIHETERRSIAKIQDTTATQAERYEVLEYWGQVPGRMLQSAGVEEAEESETYWANVWVCNSRTLHAKLMPMKRQRIPYNFFIYQKVPHSFWGVGPVRLMRHSQHIINGTTRSLLDGMAMMAAPMAEVNVHMLKDGQDPSLLYPGQIWLRDSGDPSVPAVRFFQPQIPAGQLMQISDMFRRYSDDETMLPSYTYGDTSQKDMMRTASGTSMLMGTAEKPIKAIIKNLEDGCIKPLVQSWFDWVMQWSDREEIKGDMNVEVLGTSAIMAKEVKSQNLMTFLNITGNPIDLPLIDRQYLLRQIAKTLEIDVEKAVPDAPEEAQQPQQEQQNIVEQAKAMLLQVQAEKEKALIDKIIAETANKNVQTQFSAVQTAGQVVTNPALLPSADEMLASAGYVDKNGPPIAPMPQQMAIDTGVPQNTSPTFPPLPPDPNMITPPGPQELWQPEMQSPNVGIETDENEPIEGSPMPQNLR